MEPTDATVWYLRFRGRVTGPYDRAQLEALRRRGQLSRFHEVSPDRVAWSSAASLLPQVVEPPRPKASPTPEPDDAFELVEGPGPSPAHAGTAAEWYYARDGSQVGPVGIDELRRLVSAGQIHEETLVWTAGMTAWTPVREVPGLVDVRIASANHAATRALAAELPWGTSVSTEVDLRDSPVRVATPTQVSGLAVASLVLGIVWLYGLGSLLAVIFGSIALSQIGRSNGRLGGRGMAIAGLVLGIVGVGLLVVVLASVNLAGGSFRRGAGWP
jgi:hypothetical protein